MAQILQLSGYDLQKQSPTEVEEAISKLKTIAEEQNIQTKRLIQSVVDLFYDNWGRKDGNYFFSLTLSFTPRSK
jgi:phosphopantetheinyl transferase